MKKIANTKECNCREPNICPLSGKCLTSEVVYQATVKTNDNKQPETYVGISSNNFKSRYNNHLSSFRNIKKLEE